MLLIASSCARLSCSKCFDLSLRFQLYLLNSVEFLCLLCLKEYILIRVSGFKCRVTESYVGFSCVVSGHGCLINDEFIRPAVACHGIDMGQLSLTQQLHFDIFGWTGFACCSTERLWFELLFSHSSCNCSLSWDSLLESGD